MRKIYISAKPFSPIVEKHDNSRANMPKGIQQKSDTPIAEKDDYSNTRNNSVVSRKKTAATTAAKKVEVINDSEFLSIRNEATQKNEVMNSEIKKEINALKNVSTDQFTKMVCTYKMVVDIIKHQNLQQYLYYPVWNYDFVQFVKKINWFCDNYNPHAVINKLAKKDELKTITRFLNKQSTTKAPEKAVVEMMDKEVARYGRKKIADILKNK